MLSVRQEVDCALWLPEPKSYTYIRRKFNQVHSIQKSPICRSDMRWGKRLKGTGSSWQQHCVPEKIPKKLKI
jgi:hypothetical protein